MEVVTDLVQAASITVEGGCHSRSTFERARNLCKGVGLGRGRGDACLCKPVVGRERLEKQQLCMG